MLRARLISAAVLVPLVVYVVLVLPTPVVALVLGLVLAAGAWEWSGLVPIRSGAGRLGYCALVAGLLGLLWRAGPQQAVDWVLAGALLWWLYALYWLTHPQLCAQAGAWCAGFKALAGVLVLVPAWTALVALHAGGPDGPALVLGLLVMVWLADSGAYFAGRQWGRNKLAPVISPGKTWEGVYGGLLASLAFAGLAGAIYSRSLRWTLALLLASAVAMLFSVAGDLLESLMKRQSGIKDSGHLIPGHGGVLDRLDSLLAAAPLFVAGLLWLGL